MPSFQLNNVFKEILVQAVNSDSQFINKEVKNKIEHRECKQQPPPAEFTGKDISAK